MPRETNSPSISDLSDTPSEVQRKIREGQSVTAIELAQENERLKALLAEHKRTIDLEKTKVRDMEIQLIETQTHRETSSEHNRVRSPERTRTRGSGPGRVSFTDQSPGRLSEGSRHSARSRHDGSYYPASRASTCRDPEAKARKLLKLLTETIRDECPRDTRELTTTKPEILQYACNEVKEVRRALKDLVETYEDELEPDTEEEARQAIRVTSAQVRGPVVAKSDI